MDDSYQYNFFGFLQNHFGKYLNHQGYQANRNKQLNDFCITKVKMAFFFQTNESSHFPSVSWEVLNSYLKIISAIMYTFS